MTFPDARPFMAIWVLEVPFHDKPTVLIDVHMPRRMVALERNEDVTAAPDLRHV
jgi:hypothetical protein